MNTIGVSLPQLQANDMASPKPRFNLVVLDGGNSITMSRKSSRRVVYVQEGDVQISYLNGRRVKARATQLVYLSVSEAITIYAEQPTTLLILDVVHPEEAYDRHCSVHLYSAHEDSMRVLSPGQEVVHLFESVNRYMSLGICSAEMHRVKEAEFLLLLSGILNKDKSRDRAASLDGSVFYAKVMTHIKECKTVQELACCVGMERVYFQKVFKRTFGLSPYQWMLEQKSKELLDVLERSHLPLKHIAVDFGFGSISKMNEFVKKRFGMTAKELRNSDMGRSVSHVSGPER